jgi:Ca-activated chloride channel homolog
MRSAASAAIGKKSIVNLALAGLLLSAAFAQTNAPPTFATPANNAQAPAAQPAAPSADNTAAPAAAPTSQPPADQSPDGQQPTAQPATGDDQGMFVFKKQVEEVVLHATVTDDQQHLVTNLDKTAFQVSEHGVPQVITSFRREDIPVEMGIVVDNSGSMRDKREKINQAVMNLIQASNPKDEIFVVNFSQEPYLDQDFTSDPKLLQTALHQVAAKGSTALYDAIVASAAHLRNNAHLEKKVLLVITDGQDNMSQQTLQEALRRLQQGNGPTLYSIGLMGNEGRGRDALQSLSVETGGVAYFPMSLDDVDQTTRTVAHDIRSQYMIAFRPHNQNAKPGYEDLRVEARAPGYAKLMVRTKSGYYPPDGGH